MNVEIKRKEEMISGKNKLKGFELMKERNKKIKNLKNNYSKLTQY